MAPYLQQLTGQLVDGIDKLSPKFRSRHTNWLVRQQNADGGFSGREGGSDIYYTGFALRSLAILQGLTPEICERAAGFLRRKMEESASVIDLFSLLVSGFLVQLGGADPFAYAPDDWADRVAQTLETFRMHDGGYAKATDSISGSTYHSFLVVLALELLGKPIPQPERLIDFVRSRHREDGGFVEIAPMRRSGTNPTAAGVGILQITNALDNATRDRVVEFLLQLPTEFEGGFRANDRIPSADLLSTFTGSWTLEQLGALDQLDGENIRDYALSVEQPEGGFTGGLWDQQVDVEYTFYGLGVLGLFSDLVNQLPWNEMEK